MAAATPAMLQGVSMAAGAENLVQAPGKAVASVGKITPINLLSGSRKFVSSKALADCDVCCGPYSECHICNY